MTAAAQLPHQHGTGRCLRCRTTRTFVITHAGWTTTARYLVKGPCTTCGTTVPRFLPRDQVPATAGPPPAPQRPTGPHRRKPGAQHRLQLVPPAPEPEVTDTDRRCRACREWKPLAAYAPRRTGQSVTCRACQDVRRAERADQMWREAVALLGDACPGCGEDRPIALHARPRSPTAKRQKTGVRERKTATLARLIVTLGDRARNHWTLTCANCELVRRHPGRACPR